jgi:hypothetical protein
MEPMSAAEWRVRRVTDSYARGYATAFGSHDLSGG